MRKETQWKWVGYEKEKLGKIKWRDWTCYAPSLRSKSALNWIISDELDYICSHLKHDEGHVVS